MSDWTVDRKAILGTSPILLPARCAECGRDASRGKRVDTILYWYPRWVWVGLIWGVFPMVLLYYAARRPLKISYALCREHHHTLAVKKRTVLGMWALFAAVVVAAIATRFNSYVMFTALALFVVTLVVHFAAGISLRATSYRDGVFGVVGFGREFLLTAGSISGPSPARTSPVG